jgi:hypothetical protein
MEGSITDNYHHNLLETCGHIRDTYKKLGRMLSAIDRQISGLYHSVEKTDEDELDAIAYMTQLKALLVRRRAVKDELARLKLFNGLAKHVEGEVGLHYENILRASFEVRQSLNARMTVDTVAEEMGVEGLR